MTRYRAKSQALPFEPAGTVSVLNSLHSHQVEQSKAELDKIQKANHNLQSDITQVGVVWVWPDDLRPVIGVGSTENRELEGGTTEPQHSADPLPTDLCFLWPLPHHHLRRGQYQRCGETVSRATCATHFRA